MSTEPQLFRVDPNTKAPNKILETDFADLGFKERDIQDWVVAKPDILGDDLLIVAEEFSDFDRTNERLDLLAVDPDGKLVIIELKRDHSGADVHWQAIKYASYLRQTTQEQIIRMLAAQMSLSEIEAEDKLSDHLESGALENLNHDQTDHPRQPSIRRGGDLGGSMDERKGAQRQPHNLRSDHAIPRRRCALPSIQHSYSSSGNRAIHYTGR